MKSLFDWLIEETMGAKALQNTRNTLKNADNLAFRVDNALKSYPFHEISPDLALKINIRAKKLALRVDPRSNKVNLVVPKRCSLLHAYRFAHEHRHWIKEKLAELPSPIYFEDGAVISLLGQKTTIKVVYDITFKKTDIALINKQLIVKTNKEDPAPRVIRYLKHLALKELTFLAHEKAFEINKRIIKIDVKDTSSRWGSCSHDGKLSFSWRLIFAPREAFDYVVAHEVAHLRFMDHSPAFWELCEELSTNYSKGKNWMRRNSGELVRYQ